MTAPLNEILAEVRACQLCAAQLPREPKPVLQVASSARLLIIGQAPGTKAHESGLPWDDQSGKRLREWIGLTDPEFYDPNLVAILPAGLCYPGANLKGGDKPPLRACAPLWHPQILPQLASVRLTLLVGLYAQKLYLGSPGSLTENVARWTDFLPLLPMPHPSWRVTGWMKKHQWFEQECLPNLRIKVADALREDPT